jgi:hypothetical protein
MAWSLTIAGISTVRVVAGSWQEEETDFRGVFRRVASGDAQSTQRSPKRGFSGTVFLTTKAELLALKTAISEAGAIGVAAPVTVSSSDDGGTTGDTLTCYCWLGRTQFIKNGDSVYWKAQLTVREA